MKLIGSIASPYVRRLRILLEELGADYVFKQVQVFSKEGQEEIFSYTKTRRVPILVDGDKTLWDSLLITKYLLKKYNRTEIKLELEKDLILINEANDSAISLFQVRYFELDPQNENIFSKVQFKRIKGILSYFDEQFKTDDHMWGIKANFLYCLLDWLNYRQVLDWSEFENLVEFHKDLSSKDIIQQTAP